MSITVLTNMAAMNARRHLERTSEDYQQAAERLASGKRINKASDDAAGLAISFGLESKIRSISQARRNAYEAMSFMQVTEGGMNEIGNLLVRMRELAIQSASDNIGDSERTMLEVEGAQIKSEIDRLANSATYFGTHLLNGTGKSFTFQIGPENDEYNRIEYSTKDLDFQASALGVDGVDLRSSDAALSSLEDIDSALEKMNGPRAAVGSMMARFQTVVYSLDNNEENLSAAKSRILDTDMAKETAAAVQGSVLQKTGIAVLTQANMQPAMALKLLD